MSRIFLVFSMLLMFLSAKSQTSIVLDEFKAPISPAFHLIGGEPASILKPATPKAVSTSLLTNFTNETGGFIPDVGLDIAPYWLKPRYHLTDAQYFSSSRNTKDVVKQTLSFSLATAQIDKKDSTNIGTILGVGFRFQILGGKTFSDKRNVLNLYKKNLQVLKDSSVYVGIIDALKAIIKQPELNTITTEEFNTLIDGKTESDTLLVIKEALKEKIKATGKKSFTKAEALKFLEDILVLEEVSAGRLKAIGDIKALDKNRPGLTLEIAGASTLRFPNNQFDYSQGDKIGIWATASWIPYPVKVKEGKEGKLTHRPYAVFVTRYLHHFEVDTIPTRNSFDVGFGLGNEKNNFKYSFEVLFRGIWAKEDIDAFVDKEIFTGDNKQVYTTYRIAFNVEYKLSETVSITGTFGKDYTDKAFQYNSNLLAILGISAGINGKNKLSLQ